MITVIFLVATVCALVTVLWLLLHGKF